jgi:uncharacterized membrane protein
MARRQSQNRKPLVGSSLGENYFVVVTVAGTFFFFLVKADEEAADWKKNNSGQRLIDANKQFNLDSFSPSLFFVPPKNLKMLKEKF